MTEFASINLSLVSHTNVGKTTLARTLLKRDIGEVRDRPHVTALPEPHVMIEDGVGGKLILWDTPGFGDSVRLAKRLSERSNPIGWFIAEIWDRWASRPLWSSQQAMKNVRDQSDVVLYLVNASENPAETTYVDAEMQILSWIGKPVLVLLNQMGKPRPQAVEEAERSQWVRFLDRFPLVASVLPLDAFARCWVQELALFDAIGQALPPGRQPGFRALQSAWIGQRVDAYEGSVQAIGKYLALLAKAVERVESPDVLGKVKSLGRKIGWATGDEQTPESIAMARLAESAAKALKSLTDQLIELNGLKGEAAQEILQRVQRDLDINEEVSATGAAVVGAVLSGAISGLATDLLAGGLTGGAGMLTGAVLGGLGFAAVAKGYNLSSGKDGTTVRWNADAMARFFSDALLLYLAVAHFGRGRGEWSRSESPAHWREEVGKICANDGANLAKTLAVISGTDEHTLAQQFSAAAGWGIRSTLARLYPATQMPQGKVEGGT